jgi:hypothetical protein
MKLSIFTRTIITASLLYAFAVSRGFADVCENDGKVRVHVTQRSDGALGFVLYTERGCYGIGPENFFSPGTIATARENAASKLFGSDVTNGVKGVFGLFIIAAAIGDQNKMAAADQINKVQDMKFSDTDRYKQIKEIFDPKFLVPDKCESPPEGMTVATYKAALAEELGKLNPAPAIVAESAAPKRAPAKSSPPRARPTKKGQGTSAAN